MVEKQQFRKKRLEPQHAMEILSIFGAHFPDERGEPVKISTMSGVFEGGAGWLAVGVAAGGGFLG